MILPGVTRTHGQPAKLPAHAFYFCLKAKVAPCLSRWPWAHPSRHCAGPTFAVAHLSLLVGPPLPPLRRSNLCSGGSAPKLGRVALRCLQCRPDACNALRVPANQAVAESLLRLRAPQEAHPIRRVHQGHWLRGRRPEGAQVRHRSFCPGEGEQPGEGGKDQSKLEIGCSTHQ